MRRYPASVPLQLSLLNPNNNEEAHVMPTGPPLYHGLRSRVKTRVALSETREKQCASGSRQFSHSRKTVRRLVVVADPAAPKGRERARTCHCACAVVSRLVQYACSKVCHGYPEALLKLCPLSHFAEMGGEASGAAYIISANISKNIFRD